MESLLEVLVGLFFLETNDEKQDEEYNREYALLYQVIKEEGLEDCFNEAIKWIDPNLVILN